VLRIGNNFMAKIEGIRIKNFMALKDIIFGKLWNTQQTEPLAPMTAVIGKNGVGKSSLFDAFGFLSDCLQKGVEEACDMRGRGGMIRSTPEGVLAQWNLRFTTKKMATLGQSLTSCGLMLIPLSAPM